MKLIIGIVICVAIFVAVVAMLAYALALMATIGCDLTEEDREPELAEVRSIEKAEPGADAAGPGIPAQARQS